MNASLTSQIGCVTFSTALHWIVLFAFVVYCTQEAPTSDFARKFPHSSSHRKLLVIDWSSIVCLLKTLTADNMSSIHALPDDHPADARHFKFSPELRHKLALGGIQADDLRRGPRPNIALFVTQTHELYQEEIPYPSPCAPDSW